MNYITMLKWRCMPLALSRLLSVFLPTPAQSGWKIGSESTLHISAWLHIRIIPHLHILTQLTHCVDTLCLTHCVDTCVMFVTCSWHVRDMFVTCSWHVRDMFVLAWSWRESSSLWSLSCRNWSSMTAWRDESVCCGAGSKELTVSTATFLAVLNLFLVLQKHQSSQTELVQNCKLGMFFCTVCLLICESLNHVSLPKNQ